MEDQKQSDIARELGVSRPLISRMLSEARELGIVEITIHEDTEFSEVVDTLEREGLIEYKFLFKLFSWSPTRRRRSPPAPTPWTPKWTTAP